MKTIKKILTLFLLIGCCSCIQEDIINDFVSEEVRIISDINTLKIGDTLDFEAAFFNNVGELEDKTFSWNSSNDDILYFDGATSKAIGIAEGAVTITVTADGMAGMLTDSKIVTVTQDEIITENTKIGTFSPTSSYDSAGDFVISSTPTGIKIDLADNYVADESLPGFALFLTNNPNSLASALQIDAWNDDDGAHYTGAFTYNIENVGLNDYGYLVQWCVPFSILTGKASITDQ